MHLVLLDSQEEVEEVVQEDKDQILGLEQNPSLDLEDKDLVVDLQDKHLVLALENKQHVDDTYEVDMVDVVDDKEQEDMDHGRLLRTRS